MSIIVRYNSNNSGGRWWLDDSDWEALEAAGWNVHWGDCDAEIVYGNEPMNPVERDDDNRWLGASARSCAGKFSTAQEGVDNFETVAGQQAADIGCNCCGPPHSFEWIEEAELLKDKPRWNSVELVEPCSGYLKF